MSIYQVNIIEEQQKSFLVKANNAAEAVRLLKLNTHAHGIIALDEAIASEVEKVDEVFPIRFEEDVMSKESQYYNR